MCLININSNLDNYVGVKNLTTYATQTYNTSVHVPIEFDGYLCERVNFTAQSGYSVLYIKDENKETLFTHQLNCGVNVGYAHDGSFLPVKKGWYFYIEGQSIQSVQIKFSHI